jgi:hypothetical protein
VNNTYSRRTVPPISLLVLPIDLENPGKIPLELIEVQTGGYIGEDDITRLEDLYGRHRADG